MEKEALWRRIVLSKFGEAGGWLPSRVTRHRRSGCWGVLSYLGDVAGSCGEVFS